MKGIIIISLIMICLMTLGKTQPQNNNNNRCNEQNCPSYAGQCNTMNECICESPYITMIEPMMSTTDKYCNYRRTSRWVPFFMELLVPSLGHFYIGKLYFGIIKLSMFLTPFILALIGFSIYDVDKPNECIEQMTYYSFGLIFPLFFIFYIVDLVLFGLGRYSDGYGMALL